MSTRGYVTVYDGTSERYVALRGRIADLLSAQRIPAQRDRATRCSWLRRERLDDVLGLLEASGYSVRMIKGDPR
ncbi:hypothetical protein [Flexivirga oryzae]|uniref:Uncharacterized protein n=1 Tax=Flexivirga oryzae TaxID=1794944 RepID=A0A839NF68_9MICO|nr:hypothetical protein [Flexivirga oryzae]MBB2894574.1 hypothetical protein [Flexivirga oryzae]